jgi:SAM-dependent methyltransferase
MTTLINDGSRYLPWSGDALTGFEHLHRYLLARTVVAGRRVLDIACGEGYGAALLADSAARVVGVDIDRDAIRHAAGRYVRPNVYFFQADAQRFALAPASVDVVVSFETLEHFPDQAPYLAALKRALVPDGVLLISTPNKGEYNREADPNPHHARELDRAEFVALLGRYFANVQVYGQNLIMASALAPDGGASGFLADGDTPRLILADLANPGAAAASNLIPRYYVAVCSDGPLPALPATLYSDPAIDLYRAVILPFVKQIQAMYADYQALKRDDDLRIKELEEGGKYARGIEKELGIAKDYIQTLEVEAAARQAELDRATEYVRKLEAESQARQAALEEAATFAQAVGAESAARGQLLEEAQGYIRHLEEQIARLEAKVIESDNRAHELSVRLSYYRDVF